MKRLLFIFLGISLLLSVSSCLKDDGPNFHFKPLQIISAELPESFEVDGRYQILVTYSLPDGCTSFSHPNVTASDTTTRNVVIWGTERTDQEACTQVVTEGQASFSFICLYDEPYVFRFWQGEGENGEQEYFEVTVPVN